MTTSAARRRAEKVTARAAAAALGKALFWDMQVGSDAVQACGTCHFHAGADNRTKNQTNPEPCGRRPDPSAPRRCSEHGPDGRTTFRSRRYPDTSNDPGNPNGNVNDVASSMGVRFRTFVDIRPIGGRGRSVVRSARRVRREDIAAGHRQRPGWRAGARPDRALPGPAAGRAAQHPDTVQRGHELRQLLGWPCASRLQRWQRVRPDRPAGARLRLHKPRR